MSIAVFPSGLFHEKGRVMQGRIHAFLSVKKQSVAKVEEMFLAATLKCNLYVSHHTESKSNIVLWWRG